MTKTDPGAVFSKGQHMCGDEQDGNVTYLGVLEGSQDRESTRPCVCRARWTRWFTSWQCWDPPLGCPLYLCPSPTAVETLILTGLGRCPMLRRSGESLLPSTSPCLCLKPRPADPCPLSPSCPVMLVVGDNAPAEDGVVSVTVLTRGGRLEPGAGAE